MCHVSTFRLGRNSCSQLVVYLFTSPNNSVECHVTIEPIESPAVPRILQIPTGIVHGCVSPTSVGPVACTINGSVDIAHWLLITERNVFASLRRASSCSLCRVGRVRTRAASIGCATSWVRASTTTPWPARRSSTWPTITPCDFIAECSAVNRTWPSPWGKVLSSLPICDMISLLMTRPWGTDAIKVWNPVEP